MLKLTALDFATLVHLLSIFKTKYLNTFNMPAAMACIIECFLLNTVPTPLCEEVQFLLYNHCICKYALTQIFLPVNP